MLLLNEDQILDRELSLLNEFLLLVDDKLTEVNRLISLSADPDSDGLCDKGEYFIGIGFVAMQQYMTDTLLFRGISKESARNLGPMHTSGISYASLINSAANWWKHEAEWVNAGRVPSNGTRTFEHVASVAPENGYELSNVLASLCTSGDLSLCSVLPWLLEWRNAVAARSINDK